MKVKITGTATIWKWSFDARHQKSNLIFDQEQDIKNIWASESGCGSVGKAVASDTRGLPFKSNHQQKFINIEHLFSVYWKDGIKEKEAGNGPFLYKIFGLILGGS